MEDLKKYLFVVCCCHLFFSLQVTGQCTEVVSTEDQSHTTCASLHLYKDETYSERVINVTVARNSWIFAGIVSDTTIEFNNCWAVAEETGNRYRIIEEGCSSEATYVINRAIERFHKVYGKFLQFSSSNENRFRLECDATKDCPVVTECRVRCTRQPPRNFRLSSELILLGDGSSTEGGTSESGGLSRDTLIILLVAIAAAIFLILLIVLIVVICVTSKKRKRRRQARDSAPVLVNSNAADSGYVRASAPIEGEQSEDSFNPTAVYAVSMKKTAKTSEM